MLQIDRMEVDDVGGNPRKLALAVLKQLRDLAPPVPVREIAEALDIYEIREEQLTGLEGCLITTDDKSDGAILVNSDGSEQRKRYTIGHELGHYVNPFHKPVSAEGFRCSSSDMSVEQFSAGNRALRMEVEANTFAAELLMPAQLFRSRLDRIGGLDLGHILSLADEFCVSREATARRCVAMADEPIAVVFSNRGVIRYVKRHPSFPRLNVWSGDRLPVVSLSALSSLQIGELSEWDVVASDVWLDDREHQLICEQTLAQRNGFRMTLLSLENPSVDDDEQEYDQWASPTFRR
ncbi:MAG: ImmA/IrrE family metallo-endopeptidase [Pseudomonadota bacterium]